MSGFRKILVGLETIGEPPAFSEQSEAALRQTIDLATADRAEVVVMTVLQSSEVQTEDLMEATENPLGPMEQVQKLHADVTTRAQQRGVSIISRIVNGNVEEELIREAQQENCDLLVVGVTSRSQLPAAVSGTTATKLLRKSPCPIWVARREAFAGDIVTVIAADDLGETGEKVIQVAVNVAQLLDARLLILHAIQKAASEAGAVSNAYVLAEVEVAIQKRLAKTDYRTIQQGTLIEVTSGDPEESLAEAVRRHQASLLVMGTQARGGLSGFLLGNSAERLLPDLPCSVLAIKPDQKN